MTTVGERIRLARLEAGLSQRQLAAPGVSCPYISRIEANARRPSVKALRKIAPKLGVSVTWLETGKDLVDVRLQRDVAAILHARLAADDGWRSVSDQALYEALGDALSQLREPRAA